MGPRMNNTNKHQLNKKNKLFISLFSHTRNVKITGTEPALKELILMSKAATKNNKKPVISRFYRSDDEYFNLQLSMKDSNLIKYATPNIYQYNKDDRFADGDFSIIVKMENNNILKIHLVKGYYNGAINYVDNSIFSSTDFQKIEALALLLNQHIINNYKNKTDLIDSVCKLSFFKSEYIKNINNKFCDLISEMNHKIKTINYNTRALLKNNNYKIVNVGYNGGRYDDFVIDMTPTALQAFHDALINVCYRYKTKKSVMYIEDTANKPFSISINIVKDTVFDKHEAKYNQGYSHFKDTEETVKDNNLHRLIVNLHESPAVVNVLIDGYLVDNDLLVKIL